MQIKTAYHICQENGALNEFGVVEPNVLKAIREAQRQVFEATFKAIAPLFALNAEDYELIKRHKDLQIEK